MRDVLSPCPEAAGAHPPWAGGWGGAALAVVPLQFTGGEGWVEEEGVWDQEEKLPLALCSAVK